MLAPQFRTPPHNVFFIPGEGASNNTEELVRTVLNATNLPLKFAQGGSTEEDLANFGTSSFRCILRGPSIHGKVSPVQLRGKTYESLQKALISTYDLYASVRLIHHGTSSNCRIPGLDLVVICENTEGACCSEEVVVDEDKVTNTRVITREKSLRLARFAFRYAKEHQRKVVTAVHRAEASKEADKLFLSCCQEVSKEFPELEYTEELAESLAGSLFLATDKHDVLICENIVADLIAGVLRGILGGDGAPAGHFGDNVALFESCHSVDAEKDIQGTASPISMLLALCMMLEFWGEPEAASWVRDSLEQMMQDGHDISNSEDIKELIEELVVTVARTASFASPTDVI